jgi:Flp pilus assembly protein TadD
MALHENPLLPEVQIAYGELELAGGDPLIAIEAFEAARNLLQSDPQLEARTGQALLALGRDAEALEHLRDAIDGGYTPPDVQRAFALALVANGLYAEAERLIADIPADQSKDLGIVRGYLLLERGANAEAEAVLRQVAEDRPTDPAVLNMLATVVYRQQRYPEAVALLQRAVELDPSNELWSANLANAASALSAEALASNAAAVRPATP